MLRKRVIVCLDVRDGRVVKGVQFVNLRDMGDPVELAARYEEEGADEVVFLDISASAEGRRTLLDVVSRTAERLFIPLTVGGGVTGVEDIAQVLRSGADKVSVNTAAVRRPQVLTEAARRFGSQCVVISIDASREAGNGPGSGVRIDPSGGALPEARGEVSRRMRSAALRANRGDETAEPAEAGKPDLWYRVYTHGGRALTDLDAIEWSRRAAELGAGEVLITSIDEDGRRQGYDLDLTDRIVRAVNVPVIASGGAGRAEHLRDALAQAGADAALAAGIFHDGTTTVAQVKRVLAADGIPVRPVAGTPVSEGGSE